MEHPVEGQQAGKLDGVLYEQWSLEPTEKSQVNLAFGEP